VIAALSKDPVMIEAILNGLDIHGWWATRLDEMFPGLFLKKQGLPCVKQVDHSCQCDKCEFKAFRNKCKNGLVFPLCFGSQFDSIGENMGIADNEQAYNAIGNEFWGKHKVVHQWQENLLLQMNKLNYIENAFGRRYRGPLKREQIINYPIQGTASDIVTRAMVRLCKLSVQTKLKYLQPVINIHDDLCFYIPEEKLNDALAEIIPVMLDTRPLTFMPIPLLAEVAVGTHWANTKEIGTFSSEDLYGIPHPYKAA
jgi:DNA polymerase I-like protein with 3'-5' exonuclease and polymerase domains